MTATAITNEEILKKARNILSYMVDIRRNIHMYPEVGMQEFKTSGLICNELETMGIPFKNKVGGTGVVGLISGNKQAEGKKKVIALRADMDALTIQETSKVSYASKVDGVMHACGHDGHVAMLLGAALILNQYKDAFPGAVKLLFQPAEEGPGGALPMIKDGALKNPQVNAVIGIHLSSSEATGRIGLKAGPFHAAHDEFEILIKGHGGHAAYPHRSVDAIVLAAQVINALQTVVSRKVDPLIPAVLTVGTIKGGYRHNIIADRVTLEGTFRYIDESLKMDLRKWTEEIVSGITKSAGGDYEIRFFEGYPVTVNDEGLYEKVKTYLGSMFGPDVLYEVKRPSMGAEDFSYYCEVVPSLFIKLGSGGPNKEFSAPHHHPEFDLDENAFVNGVAAFVKIVLDYLNE